MPKVSDLIDIVNKIAPASLAESWDNPGLQLGSHSADVHRIMVALDPVPEVVKAAVDATCQLLITHHPLIFKPLASITTASAQGRSIHCAITAGLSILTLHTNYDIATGGLNDLLAGKIGLNECRPLRITTAEELAKLVVFVPEDHVEKVRGSLLPFTRLQGNYRDCSFAAGGEGTFTPQDGAEPFIGTVGSLQRVNEQRLELLVERTTVSRAVKALLAAHPYEEPAFDLYPLLNEGVKLGLGRVGRLAEPLMLKEYAARVGRSLDTTTLRFVGEPDRIVSKVALCSGSGASLLKDAVRAGADVLVTGDVKYHEARDAEDAGIALIDAGHFPTEIIMVDELTERLAGALANSRYSGCQVIPCHLQCDPFKMYHN
ncbi:MAG: Nif3-like dinuclear metal center hexameric protein [Desulfuromonadales bacterium]